MANNSLSRMVWKLSIPIIFVEATEIVDVIRQLLANTNLDEHRRSILGVAMVSNDKRYVEGALSKLVDYVRLDPNAVLQDYQIELL